MVGRLNVCGRADDLPAAGVVGAWYQSKEFVIRQLVVANQRNASSSHFTQIVRRHFGGQTHCNATGAIEQHKRQASRKLLGLVKRTLVVGHEIHGAFVQFIQQQARDRGQARFGVTHGGCAIAVAGAEIALTVDQRITLRKILRHAHEGVVGGGVTVRVVFTDHITDHTRTLDRLGAAGGGTVGVSQAQAFHGEQDAALHGLLPIAHIGQSPAFNHAQGVFQVSPFGVSREGNFVVRVVEKRRSHGRSNQTCTLVRASYSIFNKDMTIKLSYPSGVSTLSRKRPSSTKPSLR